MNNYITADIIKVWFSKHVPCGAPINADEIAPALNAAFNAIIDADPKGAYYDYAITGNLAFSDFMNNYLRGKHPEVPRPIVIGAQFYLPDVDTHLPPVGTTLTGDDAEDKMWNLASVEEARENANKTAEFNRANGYKGNLDFKVARWQVTINTRKDEDPYIMTRIEDAE